MCSDNPELEKSRSYPELTEVAYHEAGHAVIFYLLKLPIMKISIIPNQIEEALGYVASSPSYHQKYDPKSMTVKYQPESPLYWTENRKIKHIKTFLAGYITGDILKGEKKEIDLSSPDYEMAISLANDMCSSEEEVNALLTYLWWNIYNTLTLDVNWFLVEALAHELLAKKEISGRQVKILLEKKEKEYLLSKRKVS